MTNERPGPRPAETTDTDTDAHMAPAADTDPDRARDRLAHPGQITNAAGHTPGSEEQPARLVEDETGMRTANDPARRAERGSADGGQDSR